MWTSEVAALYLVVWIGGLVLKEGFPISTKARGSSQRAASLESLH